MSKDINIVILTSNDIRHNYFKIMFSNAKGINVLQTYAESSADFELKRKPIKSDDLNYPAKIHFDLRHNNEYDFFSDIIENCEDRSNTKFISKNEINESNTIADIISLNPDFIITYGCSIIKKPLIEAFENRIINVHLGLSPYYFGSGTNFHAMVNGDFQCIGYTFMYMDAGIDTGKIIHQSRAEILPLDNPHQIGNRLIKKMTKEFICLVKNFSSIKQMQPVSSFTGKTYKRKDATDKLTVDMYNNFSDNAVLKYLADKDTREEAFPLVQQEFMTEFP